MLPLKSIFIFASKAQLLAYLTSQSAIYPISSCEINFFNMVQILNIILVQYYLLFFLHYLFSNSSNVSCINATASTMFTDTSNNCWFCLFIKPYRTWFWSLIIWPISCLSIILLFPKKLQMTISFSLTMIFCSRYMENQKKEIISRQLVQQAIYINAI